MQEYSYRVSEHDPERRWIVLEQRHETIQLDHDVEFFEWSAAPYPHERYTVQLETEGQIARRYGVTGQP